MEHSEGPWVVIFDKIMSNDRLFVCYVAGGLPDGVKMANALLLAAAPDLLAACQAALVDLEPFEYEGLDDGYAVEATVGQLRAALARATETGEK